MLNQITVSKMNKLKLPNYQHFFSIFITMLALMWSGWALKMDQKTDKYLFTDPPLSPGHPFLLIWNAPTELCEIHHKLPLDLSHFHIISSTLKDAFNQTISLFYVNRFGRFPYYEHGTNKEHNGGLPQLLKVADHHYDADYFIKKYIPFNQEGLAVLDFEEWRPLWIRNWSGKRIYRDKSIELVMKRNASLSPAETTALAIEEFEDAAKRYFIDSLRIGKKLRPKRLWGYYLFPDCYNYGFNREFDKFTGECPVLEKKRNDRLMWLWRECTALYPSLYLELKLNNTEQALWFIRHRMQETIRVSKLVDESYSIPIHAYIRPVYKNAVNNYMSEEDLVKTIGEAAALGAASVISWGDMNLVRKPEACTAARDHLRDVMNPYILNVTTATQLCSKALCQGRGRCMRKNLTTDVYLHLNSRNYLIERQNIGGPLTVSGSLSQDDVNEFDLNFNCMCYSKGPCRSVMLLNKTATTKSGGAHGPQPLLLMMRLICLMYVVMWK
ncbi:hyaluronidase-5-like [Sebastes umbrosus]|uniref:hyaluronidase-5-like n=1 Tax=Sebastes umbrosus TaxID=72105 RepID=UPI00189D50DC|nr:hyaluronidase-5-like [Sebastes umbrosus]